MLLESIGFDKRKIVKKYNFVPDVETKIDAKISVEGLPERYVVFYGRLGEEKGIHVLMQIWNQIQDIPLVVMGSGPLEEEFKAWSATKDNVCFLGYMQHDRCLSIVKGGEFVVFPSIWYEGCSMVEVETESLGIALVATDLGFSAEAIKDGINGYKIPLGNIEGFVMRIRELWNRQDECRRLGENARKDYEAKYLPEDNYQQLVRIYGETIQNFREQSDRE